MYVCRVHVLGIILRNAVHLSFSKISHLLGAHQVGAQPTNRRDSCPRFPGARTQALYP